SVRRMRYAVDPPTSSLESPITDSQVLQSVRGPARDVYVRLSQPYTHDADSPMLDDKKAEGLHPRSGDVQSNVWSMRAALYAAVFSTEAAILAGAALGVMISYIISISTDVSDKLAKFDALTKAKSPMATQLAAFNELLHTRQSWSKWLQIPGNMYISGLQCCMVPLIYCAVVIGITHMSQHLKVHGIAWRFVVYGIMTAIAASSLGLGLMAAIPDNLIVSSPMWRPTTLPPQDMSVDMPPPPTTPTSAFECPKAPSAPPTYLGINGTTLQFTCISKAQNISIITPMVGTDVLGKLPSTSPSDLVFDVVLNMFPKSLVGSFAQLDGFLSVSVASVVIGAATASCADENHFVLVGVLQELHAILLTMIQMIVRWTPVAIFSIVSSSLVVNVPTTWNFPSDATVPDGQLERMMSVPFAQAKLLSSSFFESESIADMGIPALVGVFGVGTILHCVVLLPLFTLAMIQQNPFAYAKQLARPLGIGFCIASSLASLPMVTEAMFVCRSASKELTQAVLSLGTIMHLDGAAFYFASCITFLVRTQGIDLTGDLAAKILLVSVIHSWSCPPLPHGGILTLGALWYTIAPGEMYHRNFSALVAIDFVLDRLCTLMSVWSNTLVLRIIADQTQELYYDDATGDDDASVVVEAPEGALNYDDYGDVLLSSRQFSYMPEIAPAPQ
ncbi:hypothetical protein H310_04731, partial [Aphanomyces invadans]